MSVRVNLLPEATKAKGRVSQQRNALLGAFALLLVALAGTYWWASSQVNRTEQELATEQDRTAQLRREQAELVAFRELADRRTTADRLLTTSLSGEASFAGILQDLAVVLPDDTQLDSLMIDVDPPDEPVPGGYIGSFTITGRTLTSHAPGVEQVLLSLDKIVSFRDLYLNSSSLEQDDERIASFSLDGRIGQEASTDRYVEGLPEELR